MMTEKRILIGFGVGFEGVEGGRVECEELYEACSCC
jgi:hypothetical protein